jgi:hypothetical protein
MSPLTRGQRRKNRIETPLEPPDAAAGPDIDVMDLPRRELLGAPDVVDVIGIAAINQNVTGLKGRQKIGNGLVDNRRRNHQPDRPRLFQLFDKVGERPGANGAFSGQLGHSLGGHVENHALVASPEKAPYHVRDHPAEADQSELHGQLLLQLPRTLVFVRAGENIRHSADTLPRSE